MKLILVRSFKKSNSQHLTYASFYYVAYLKGFLYLGIPFLALTGTADVKMKQTIMKDLYFKKDKVVLDISPERSNIRFTIVKTKRENHVQHIQWLTDVIGLEKENMPQTIIFCTTMQDVAKLSGHLGMLNADAYVTDKPFVPANRLPEIYHSMTRPKYKCRVTDSFKQDSGCVKVVVATSALSMGVNFPDVKFVIHICPARSTVDHVQEAGRASRNGKPAHNVIIYHGNQLSQGDKAFKTFCKTDTCIRKALFEEYAAAESLTCLHDCCSNCAKCLCGGRECRQEAFPFDNPMGSLQPNSTITTQRTVNAEDCSVLHEALTELQSNLNGPTLSVFRSSSVHGFSTELINELVAEASFIFSVSDILKRFPVFNIVDAKLVLEIFKETFEDIARFEEIMQTLPEDLFNFFDNPGEKELTFETFSSSESEPEQYNSHELENL